MQHFPSDIKFKFPWRSYQQRVLDELDGHLKDNHLHIVAPPGSGKTVLGLEVALRLNQPTLIFAPTLAIRNQWIQRFCELFLQVNSPPAWISLDIKNPKFLTAVTYQSLHAACTNDEEWEESDEEFEEHENLLSKGKSIDAVSIISKLKDQGIATIVVDEAHHLKNAWWVSLTKVKEALDTTVVGLTATPPYDVSPKEWQNYIQLNGPVDAEISIPELVAAGDLCPHQDYIFVSKPTKEESKAIGDHREKVRIIAEEIKADPYLINVLENLPFYIAPKKNLEWIYENISFYSSLLIFLNGIGKKIDKAHLQVIGDKKFKIPFLTYEWLEKLLTFYLFEGDDHFVPHENHRLQLINKLRKHGTLERQSVNFNQNDKISRALSASINKLKSINHIVDFEAKNLKNELRMVVLTDYIRKSYLVNRPTNELPLKQIGVIPIFEQIRRHNLQNVKLGVLTGSLIIIPSTAIEFLLATCQHESDNQVTVKPLSYDNSYCQVSASGIIKTRIVSIITRLFQAGYIEVLVGTKSLLGEGWDAPSINALILASFVGSYVQSNQMRGRAIRTSPTNIDKTSNIWHLVCLDPNATHGGEDIDLLSRRFKSFVGISFGQDITIENGINRLQIPKTFENTFDSEADVAAKLNQVMLLNASERKLLHDRWKEALQSGKVLVEEVKIPFPKGEDYWVKKKLYYKKTIAYLVGVLFSALAGFGLESFLSFLKAARGIKSWESFFYWLTYVGITAIIIFGSYAYNTLRVYIKFRDISKDVDEIAGALLQALIKIEVIKTDRSELSIVSNMDFEGAVYCYLEGGTTFEKSTFIKCLQEVVAYIENPRYIIVRKSFFLKLIAQRDYHAVPEILGRKKVTANYFKQAWSKLVGRCNLIYTRTLSGRKFLLKARMQSLAGEFEDEIERVNKWQ